MKALFTVDSLLQGGTEQSILELFRHFSDEVKPILVYLYPNHDLLPAFQKLSCTIYFLDLKGKYDWVSGVRKLSRILRHEKPDIVVSSLFISNIISRISCKRMNLPLVGSFVTDSYGRERRETFHGIGGFFKFWLPYFADRMTSQIPNAWIANGKEVGISNAKKLRIPNNKITVIYRGRRATDFRRYEKSGTEEFCFLTIGRLFEIKGYFELLSAFVMVHQQYPNSSLHIYGEGPLRQEIITFINRNKLEHQVILHGKVANAAEKIHEGHCFVFPSRFEGFSGALVEAMMVGIPIIASDIPMNLEAVKDNRTALIHKVKDPIDLSSKMKEMIQRYTEMIEMGRAAREEAIRRFDIKTISSQYEAFLYEVANNK